MQEFDWKNNIDNREEKEKLAKKIAQRVKNNEVIGFGSGSTSYLAILEIGKKIKKENIKIKAIPTSNIIENLCKELEIEITNLEKDKLDWCFDGADEVDKNNNIIKGMGAALYREKKNISNSSENYILVDKSKFVDKLGEKHPVPVECDEDKIENIKNSLYNLGADKIILRKTKNSQNPLITDNNKVILDAWFKNIEEELETKINKIDGVLDNGLFMNYNIKIIKIN